MAWWARLSNGTKLMLVAAVGVGGFALYRWRKNQAANAAMAQGGASATSSGAGIDPLTGQSYASELASESAASETPPQASFTLPSGATYTGPADQLAQAGQVINPTPAQGGGAGQLSGAVTDSQGNVWIGIPNPQAAVAYAKQGVAIGYDPQYTTVPNGAVGNFVKTGWPPPRGTVSGNHTFYAEIQPVG